MQKLFSYMRFSSSSQIGNTSIHRQTESARRYAELHGYEYSEIRFQDLGVSGFKKVDRIGLEEMFAAIKNGSIQQNDLIFIENCDRLTRQGFQETNDQIKSIVRSGVNLYFESENTLFANESDLNEMTTLMKIVMSASLAYEESLKKSQRIKAAKDKMKQNVLQGIPQKVKLPHWLKFNELTNQFELGDTTIIEKVIELRKQGYSTTKIASTLNTNGITSPTGKKFGTTSIKSWLTNINLYGAYQVGDNIVENYLPALMTYQQFRTLYVKQKSTKPVTNNNQWSGMLYCSCGSALGMKHTVSSGKSKEKIKGYYCIKARVSGCNAVGFFRPDEYLRVMVSHIATAVDTDDSEKERLVKDIDTLTASIEACANTITPTTAVIMAKKINEFEKEKAEKQKRLDALEIESDVTPEMLLSDYDNPIVFNQKAKLLIDRVVVDYKGGRNRKHMFSLRMHQKNGHIVSLTKLGSGNYFVSKTEQFEQLTEVE
ncbi:recombinase family protein [Vibrio owensii]|uniref:recombinase family protein n=1 Tax=Vibrio owensii TaxID=696485 RepID=UPI002F3FD1C2